MRPRLRPVNTPPEVQAASPAKVDQKAEERPDQQLAAGRRGWYRAVLEVDGPESAVHATAILNHLAVYHAAVVQHAPDEPVLAITLQAHSISHACQASIDLVRATGYRPIRVDIVALAYRWPLG